MKILVPLREYGQIETFVQAGADEFYFGFADVEWNEQFGDAMDLNRMSTMGENANHFFKKDIGDVVERIHEKDCKCYLALNGNIYNRAQIQYFEEILQGLKNKPDGIIFSDIQLIAGIEKAGMDPVASTMCAIYNTDILEFYKKTGVKRVILPRELNLEEIREFTSKYPDMEFEAFLMRDGCMFSDSNCLGVHRENFGGVCGYIRQSDVHFSAEFSNEELQKKRYRHFLYTDAMLRNACGLCAIYRLMEMGISAVKIVGRADRTEEVAKDIVATKRNIEIAKKCSNEQEYLENMSIPVRWKMVCGMSCYYPEVLKKQ